MYDSGLTHYLLQIFLFDLHGEYFRVDDDFLLRCDRFILRGGLLGGTRRVWFVRGTIPPSFLQFIWIAHESTVFIIWTSQYQTQKWLSKNHITCMFDIRFIAFSEYNEYWSRSTAVFCMQQMHYPSIISVCLSTYWIPSTNYHRTGARNSCDALT